MNRSQNVWRKTAAVSFAITAVVALGGCASGSTGAPESISEEHGSDAHLTRAQLYPDIDALASDSAAIVVGTVTEQRVAADIDDATDFTISSFEVSETLKSNGSTEPGAVVDVRQIGSEEQAAPTDLLTPGSTYLLYLTPSGLEGELASQYYVTGANAGLYEAVGSENRSDASVDTGLQFVQVDGTEGEPLPNELSINDLK